MAFGKNPRMDNRRSPSSYGSTATIAVFVALCLVGVWMMTSSSVVPVQNVVDMSSQDTQSEGKEQVSENDSQPFDDRSGDATDDATKVETIANTNTAQYDTNSVVEQNQSPPEKITENSVEEVQEENSVKENEDRKNGADDKFNTQTDSNGNFKNERRGQNMESGETNTGGDETNSELEKITGETANNMQQQFERENKREFEESSGEISNDRKLDIQIDEQKQSESQKESESKESSGEIAQDAKVDEQIVEKVDQNPDKETEQNPGENKRDDQAREQGSIEVFSGGSQSEILKETNTQNAAWSTQAVESTNEKEVQGSSKGGSLSEESTAKGDNYGYSWKLCNVTSGADYIPCLDNEEAIKHLRTTKHYEHRERHCPEEGPTCLVPLPDGYRQPIDWPNSRDKIWYFNVPHTQLAVVKGHQNWVKVTGEYLTFPGGGTQFKHGALHYIDFIQETVPDIAWGKRSRVVLDVGCGVASFGGFLFERDVLTMSFAPKDEHEAQVQFALERGIPALSAVMGTKRLPFPSRVFDAVHCARCRVPWHIEGGKLLLELNRVLRPGGYFVWSATPVYQKLEEDVEIWNAMSELTKSMCWELVEVKKDIVNKVGAAIYRKVSTNECYEKRRENNPPICQETDDPNAAWNVPLQACMHRVPDNAAERGSKWPEQWPLRLETPPYWLNDSQVGVYGKAAPEDFQSDYEHWKHVVSKSYLYGMGISWSTVRNVMDMRSIYGGFAAALRDLNVWVMNVVSIDSPDTLPIIYERGLFGIYHDWCESFSTYPRSYDLLHADHLFSKLKKRCNLVSVIAEVDRILRPEGKLIVRDKIETIIEVEKMAKSLHWEIRLKYSKQKEGLLCVQKTMWRPREVDTNIASTA